MQGRGDRGIAGRGGAGPMSGGRGASVNRPPPTVNNAPPSGNAPPPANGWAVPPGGASKEPTTTAVIPSSPEQPTVVAVQNIEPNRNNNKPIPAQQQQSTVGKNIVTNASPSTPWGSGGMNLAEKLKLAEIQKSLPPPLAPAPTLPVDQNEVIIGLQQI